MASSFKLPQQLCHGGDETSQAVSKAVMSSRISFSFEEIRKILGGEDFEEKNTELNHRTRKMEE